MNIAIDARETRYQSLCDRANYYESLAKAGLRNTINMLKEARKQGIGQTYGEERPSVITLREHFKNSAMTIKYLADRQRSRRVTAQ